MVVTAFLLLAASVWNTQKTLDRSSLKVIIYDQLIDVPSEMDFNDEVLAISERGARGWRGSVSINESDMVTLRLLEVLISGSSVGDAVELVDGEFGLGGRLVFHPVEAYGFRLPT